MDGDYFTGIFDIDIAIKKNSWNFAEIYSSEDDEIEEFEAKIASDSGTILTVYNLDRISNRNKVSWFNHCYHFHVYRWKNSR